MAIRVLVNGAHGKMGQLTVASLSKNPEFNVVGETGRGYDLADAIKNSAAEVVVDFTNAESVFRNTEIIIETGVHPIIGTSGLLQDQIEKLQRRCEEVKLGGMIVPNFSLGAVLMMKYAKEIVKYFPEVEIIEMHHTGKQDSPSGTALRTAELLAGAREVTPPARPSRETVKGARGANHKGIPVHAIRLPGFIAHQQVIFGGHGERLSLNHDSIDRECFMDGVMLACKKVMDLKKLVVGLEHVL